MPNDRPQPTLFLQSGSPETEARVADSYSGGQLGSQIFVRDGADAGKAKGYQMVQNDSVMDVLPYAGAVAWWVNVTGYRVTTDVSVAGRGNRAGIYRCVSALDDIVCVQQDGPSTVNFIDSPTAAPSTAGLIVIPSDTDAKADCLAAGTAASYPPLGVSIGTATSHVAEVDLDIPSRP